MSWLLYWYLESRRGGQQGPGRGVCVCVCVSLSFRLLWDRSPAS